MGSSELGRVAGERGPESADFDVKKLLLILTKVSYVLSFSKVYYCFLFSSFALFAYAFSHL